jgi:ElaB/YqjD/DUF883 family membrane-anchored ribosome-binding protein
MNHDETTDPPATSLQTATDAAAKTWETTKEKATEALQSGERYVRENPGTSTLSVLGIGFGLGLLVGWSVAHESRDDHTAQVRKLTKRLRHELNLD